MTESENGLDNRRFLLKRAPAELEAQGVVIRVSEKQFVGINFGQAVNAVLLDFSGGKPQTSEEEAIHRERLSLLYETREERMARFLLQFQMEKVNKALEQDRPIIFRYRE